MDRFRNGIPNHNKIPAKPPLTHKFHPAILTLENQIPRAAVQTPIPYFMKERIVNELKNIEKTEEVAVLYAVESGSRGWGFASVDSDWDVRFVYVHRPEWYLAIDDKRDVLEYPLDDNLDISGWELRKTLKLFRKSNPPLLEWLRCPIIYREHYSTAQKMRALTSEYFSPKSCIHHYLHMAIGNYREYLKGDMVRVKKYFYVLRPILACQWVERNNSMAPMEFSKLLETQVENRELKMEIENLLQRKTNGEELDIGPSIEVINDFIEERIAYYEQYVAKYDNKRELDAEKLDELFRDTLTEVWKFGATRQIISFL